MHLNPGHGDDGGAGPGAGRRANAPPPARLLPCLVGGCTTGRWQAEKGDCLVCKSSHCVKCGQLCPAGTNLPPSAAGADAAAAAAAEVEAAAQEAAAAEAAKAQAEADAKAEAKAEAKGKGKGKAPASPAAAAAAEKGKAKAGAGADPSGKHVCKADDIQTHRTILKTTRARPSRPAPSPRRLAREPPPARRAPWPLTCFPPLGPSQRRARAAARPS